MMSRKTIMSLLLVLCSVLLLTGCQQRETFPTTPQQYPEPQAAAPTAVSADAQNIFGETPVPVSINFDDGSYDPASEEGGSQEAVESWTAGTNDEALITAALFMESEYAGATPVLIDPVDKPTPTPLPPLTFTYATYEASALHLTFEAPAGWLPDDSATDTYVLTNPDTSMDYAASLSIRTIPVSKTYTKNELIKEIKGILDTIGSEGFSKFDRSNTAGRKFMNADGIYANYTGTTLDGVKAAGRVIIACNNKTLYVLHVSYPQGYTKTYVDGVYDRFRHSVKINTPAG